MAGNLSGHFIWSGWVWNLIRDGGFDNGNHLGRVNWNGGEAVSLVHSHVRIWRSVWRVDWHVDIVQAFEGRSGGVQFDDHLVGDGNHLWGTTDGRTWDDGTVLGDGGCFDDGEVQQVVGLVSCVVTVGQVLWEHGQMLIEEQGSVVVDGLCDWLTNLMRGSSVDHVQVGPSGFFWTGGGTDEQVEAQFAFQVVLFHVVGQCGRNHLWGTDTGETGPTEVVSVFEKWNTLFWGS